MQLPSSKSTTPFGARCRAVVGQIVMHGASSQWLQRITEKERPVFGNDPDSMYFTHVRFTPSGTSCSLLQATVQAWHPMQESLARTNPSRVMVPPVGCVAVGGSREALEHEVPVEERQAVLLQIPHVATGLDGVDHGNRWCPLHGVVELSEQHRLARGGERTGGVAVILGGDCPSRQVRVDVLHHHRGLLANRGARLRVRGAPGIAEREHVWISNVLVGV